MIANYYTSLSGGLGTLIFFGACVFAIGAAYIFRSHD